MDNVIDFKKKVDPKVKELFELGTAIDNLVIAAAQNGFDLFEIGAVVGHRLGEIIRNLPDKEQQADIIVDIILKRSGLSNE